MDNYKKILLFFVFVSSAIFFFRPFFFQGRLPIPSDTIVGLYHPYRDYYAKDYPRGIPYKNFLITDPVRQLYIWKELSVSLISRGQFPLWNPYEMAGKPLLGNIQSSPLYPMNVVFVAKPFYVSWSLYIFSSIILSGLGMYLYLLNKKLNMVSSLFGAFSFSFSGFSIVWLEWGNIVHTILWLPFLLFFIDKLTDIKDSSKKALGKKTIIYGFLLVFSYYSSFTAGHLQTFFYVCALSFIYLLLRLVSLKNIKLVIFIGLSLSLFVVLTIFPWFEILQFIFLSARSLDQSDWMKPGWFVPYKHLVQFIAPDFFGNPSTLNYFGEWNYAEFSGYIGVIPLFFSFLAVLFRKTLKITFFTIALGTSFLLAVPNLISYLPYVLKIPLLSTSQPTRLIGIVSMCLSVLAAYGLHVFIVEKKEKLLKKTIVVSVIFTIVFIALWGFVITNYFGNENTIVVKRNLVLPSMLYFSLSIFLYLYLLIPSKKIKILALIILFGLSIFDQIRFAQKFTPFITKDYLFPKTTAIDFLLKDKSVFRTVSTDSRILPPNFLTMYRIQTIEGYDPLYLKSYAKLITLNESGGKSLGIQNFNRIITPRNLNSEIINLLNVKYVLSFSDIDDNGFKKVFQEGQTKIYRNDNALERTFFVESVYSARDENDAMSKLFNINLKNEATVEGFSKNGKFSKGSASINYYSENKISINTDNQNEGFLVLTDAYYPDWKARIEGKNTTIYKTNGAFRGVIVPKGEHVVEFYVSLL